MTTDSKSYLFRGFPSLVRGDSAKKFLKTGDSSGIGRSFIIFHQFIVIKPQTVVDGLYFNGELTGASISFVIENTTNKISVVYKMTIDWEIKISTF